MVNELNERRILFSLTNLRRSGSEHPFIYVRHSDPPQVLRTEGTILYNLVIESLNTGTFLHDGGLFSVSFGLDREQRFWREVFT